MKRNTKTLVLTAIWGLLLLGLLAFQIKLIFLPAIAGYQPALAVGLRVPDFTLKDVEGEKLHLKSAIKNKPALLVFFSSTSQACRIEISEINNYFKSQSEPSFQMILISGEDAGTLLEFQKELNLDLPILMDRNGTVASKYQVNVVPSNFLVSKEMKLSYYQPGSEGFNVYKVQALITTKGGKLELEERKEQPKTPETPEPPKTPEPAPGPGKNQ